MQNVISAVTGNLRSIIFTFILALILVYFFSIFGFIFFQGKRQNKLPRNFLELLGSVKQIIDTPVLSIL